MAVHHGWSINSTVEDQEEEETPLLQKKAEQITGLFTVMILFFM